MAYSAFALRQITLQFRIEIEEGRDLFRDVPDATLRPEFLTQLEELAPLALAVASDKAARN